MMKSEILSLSNVSKESLLNETKKKVLEHQEKCNSFVTILENASLGEGKESKLSNIPYVLKDNFSTKGILTTGSSNTLKDYIPPYNSTVYQKLLDAGAILVAKSSMDEFGMGGFGITPHTGVVCNPYDTSLIAGGSSCGSAACVCDKVVPFAIGSDTGDSVRKPAAYCGIVGYKPTYGMISRYGLFPFASSLDHVGVLTRSVVDAAIVGNAIKGIDSHDMTTFDSSSIDLEKEIEEPISTRKLFYIKELVRLENYPNASEELKSILSQFHEFIKTLQSQGVLVEEVSLSRELLDVIPSVYTCISCAEATSNLSNLTGILFGEPGVGKNVVEQMIDHRTKGFSPLIKRRLIIGSYVLQKENQEKYFVNAQRVRNRIVSIMKGFFQKYDACILPCASSVAPKIKDVNDKMKRESSILDNHMVIGNFGGFPSITIPSSFINGMPVGINLTAEIMEDAKLLSIAYQCEKLLDFKGGERK